MCLSSKLVGILLNALEYFFILVKLKIFNCCFAICYVRHSLLSDGNVCMSIFIFSCLYLFSLQLSNTLNFHQVFTFGSVPLKTYLPDGDIDLTAFSNNQNLKDTWASEVRDMLENEEKNENAEFHVKEVQYIQAEVCPYFSYH